MHYPNFPEPLGVFRAVERPTYENLLVNQVHDAVKKQGEGTFDALFDDGETWVVN